jgi:SAM-dependent methyltransferase
MSHKEQVVYCSKIKERYAEYFNNVKVLDCGSLDINGNNRYLFTDSEYTGLDVGKGNNVDVVCPTHEYKGQDEEFDFIISTECFEHDMFYKKSIKNIIRMLKSGGMFMFTCATTGRSEHGTADTSPNDAPLLNGEWQDYYKNLTEEDVRIILDCEELFSEFEFEVDDIHKDLNFYGIRK